LRDEQIARENFFSRVHGGNSAANRRRLVAAMSARCRKEIFSFDSRGGEDTIGITE